MNWLVTLLGAVVSRVFTWLLALLGYKLAKRIALATAFIIMSAGLFVAMAQTIKATVLAARVVMPSALAQVTYFLPQTLNQWISAYVLIRLTHFLWRWTKKNLGHFTQSGH